MARGKGTANLAASLEVLAGAPLDARDVCPTVDDLYVAANWPYKYIGMKTTVQATGDTYRLVNLDVTQESSWVKDGGESITIDSTPTAGSNNAVSSDGVYTALAGKASKATNGEEDNIATIDGEGNYTDSGKSIDNLVDFDVISETEVLLKKGKHNAETKVWSGRPTYFTGANIWHDGNDLYYSNTYRFDREQNKWVAKSWTGAGPYIGNYVWHDGNDIYYSNSQDQTKLDRETGKWVNVYRSKQINYGYHIWTDGINMYASENGNYVLSNGNWVAKTWPGSLAPEDGERIWNHNGNTYYSHGTRQWVLNNGTWVAKTWNGLTNFDARYLWTNGKVVGYSNGNANYILDDTTDTWNPITWHDLASVDGQHVWYDGNDLYYSNNATEYQLYPNAQYVEFLIRSSVDV